MATRKHLEQYDKSGIQVPIYLNADEVDVGNITLEQKLESMDDEIESASEYKAPQGGIPAQDLAGDIPKSKLGGDVNDSLDKADSAIQGVTFNGSEIQKDPTTKKVQFEQVQPDWNETNQNNKGCIVNKPSNVVTNVFYEQATRKVWKNSTSGGVQEVFTLPEQGSNIQVDTQLANSGNPIANSAVKAAIDSLNNELNTLIGSGNVQGAIDTFNEVVAFLNGISSSDTLAAKLTQLAADIPTKTSELMNDSGFITANEVPASAQADWNESDTTDPAYIKNKPTIPDVSNLATKSELAGKQDTITAGTGIAISGNVISVETGDVEEGEDLPVSGGDVKDALDEKQDTLVFDNAPTEGSENMVNSGSIKSYVDSVATDITIEAISESDAKFFIRDGALCISTESFVVATASPTITHVINVNGTATVTISHAESNACVKYSLDGGTTWDDYSEPLTISTVGEHTVMAKAQVNGSPMSNVVTSTVTVEESAMPTLTTTKTSSDMTISASGNGTVVMTVDDTVQAGVTYTVNRTSANQTLSVVVTNKENNKLIATLTQNVVVPKLTVVSVKIRNFVKRVVDAGGHLIFGEPNNFDWATVTSAEWEEGYDDTTDPSNPTFDQSQVTNAYLLAVLEATQEKYDEHQLLLSAEPELDFLGYYGTKASPTKLYSVNSRCDTNSINSVYINSDGLLVASTSKVGQNSTNILWLGTTGGLYSTRFMPASNRDFSRLFIMGQNGLLDYSGTDNGYLSNTIFEGFPNHYAHIGSVGQQHGIFDGEERSVIKVVQDQNSPNIKCIDSTGLNSLLLVRTDGGHTNTSDQNLTVQVSAYINGSDQAAADYTPVPAFGVGSRTKTGYAYMQMKANSPTLVLAC